MPRPCTVCAHPARDAVDRALVGGATLAAVASRHDLGTSALSRHRDTHVSASLAALPVAERLEVARTLVDEVRALAARAGRLMDAAEADGSSSKVLGAMAETRRCIELIARLDGSLDDRPQVNVLNLHTSPEWVTLRTAILQALEPWPDAKLAVASAAAAVGS